MPTATGKLLPADLIPQEYQDNGLLPICTCGCQAQLASDFSPLDIEAPDYYEEYYDLEHWSRIETERYIIRNGKYVDDPTTHRMRHLKLLLPHITHDPNLFRIMRKGVDLQMDGVKLHSMMGFASSGKTSYLVCRGFQSIDIWPDYSEVFVASPTKVAGTYLLWNEFMHTCELLQERKYPVFLRGNCISTTDATAGVGTISFIGLDKVSSMRGKKMRLQSRGELIVAMDEVGEFPNTSMLQIIANLRSQKGLQVLTGTNFRELHGLDGIFHEPKLVAWEDLDREVDYEWPTVLNGWSTRLRAKVSPNMTMGQDYYPYLLTEDGHNELLAYGESSPDYQAYADSFPSIESVSRTLITTSDIQSSGTYEDVRLRSDAERFCFLDPSFTFGGDAARTCTLAFGEVEGTGEARIRVVEMNRLQVSEREVWDEYHMDLAKSFRGSDGIKPGIELGDRIDPFDLCALLFGKYLREHNIILQNAEYDDSMRGKLVHAMNYYLGPGPTPVYYGGSADTRNTFPARDRWVKAKGVKPVRVPMTNNELYGKMVSQHWFTAAAVIKAGYLRNGFMCEEAFGEMKKRLRVPPSATKREDVESKKTYKERNSNKSPDSADALCGCINMIVQRRLTPVLDQSDYSESSTMSIISAVEKMNLGANSRVAALSR